MYYGLASTTPPLYAKPRAKVKGGCLSCEITMVIVNYCAVVFVVRQGPLGGRLFRLFGRTWKARETPVKLADGFPTYRSWPYWPPAVESSIAVSRTRLRIAASRLSRFSCALVLRKRRQCTGVKIPKIGKRGCRGQKTPFSHRLRKGRFESKNPHFSLGLHKENGNFSTQSALFWGDGKWEFFDPKTLFSRF